MVSFVGAIAILRTLEVPSDQVNFSSVLLQPETLKAFALPLCAKLTFVPYSSLEAPSVASDPLSDERSHPARQNAKESKKDLSGQTSLENRDLGEREIRVIGMK
jgi:hypothetical protein